MTASLYQMGVSAEAECFDLTYENISPARWDTAMDEITYLVEEAISAVYTVLIVGTLMIDK